ncbi:type II secretion system F family protein [Solimonas variicoloris]|uniref:type II secretion system F family protein n=1 Tax=Solimonas variicoloris TaxID=254408 RepID=UPI000367A04C|nr:type II secretion system F family protein [Solimonas variicoloris]
MSLVFVLLFAVVLFAAAVVLVLRASERERQEDVGLRLRVLGGGEEAASTLAQMDAARQIRNPVLRWACHLIWRTGVELTPTAVLRILIALVLLIPLALLLFGVLTGLALVAMLLVIGWFLLVQKAARRRAKIIEQFPSFLESTIRVLAAGNTLDEALSSASREAPDPIKPLFVSIGRQVRLGAPLEAVLMETAEIHQLRDLKIMALAAAINRKFGGSLRNVLRSLISGIRSRDNAARELRALTAETRFSALVLAVIPIALMFYIVWQNPDYYTQMWAETRGRILLAGSIILQVAGVLVIWRMMKSTEEA